MDFGIRPSSIQLTWPRHPSRLWLTKTDLMGIPACTRILLLETRSCQLMFSIFLRQRIWNVLIRRSWREHVPSGPVFTAVQECAKYTKPLYTGILVFEVGMVMSQTRFPKRDTAVATFPMRLFSSVSRYRLPAMEKPGKWIHAPLPGYAAFAADIHDIGLSYSNGEGGLFTRIGKELRSRCRTSSVSAFTAGSSAKSISLINTLRTLVFVRSRARLKRHPSLFLCVKVNPVVWLVKGLWKQQAKMMPNSVEASTHPCLHCFDWGWVQGWAVWSSVTGWIVLTTSN